MLDLPMSDVYTAMRICEHENFLNRFKNLRCKTNVFVDKSCTFIYTSAKSFNPIISDWYCQVFSEYVGVHPTLWDF